MKTNTLSKSDALLKRAFTMEHRKNGRWIALGGQCDTDAGTPSLWRFLEQSGYVEKATKSGRGILGHLFSRRLTDEGRARVAELCAAHNQSVFDPNEAMG